jgi:hypothetical protein
MNQPGAPTATIDSNIEHHYHSAKIPDPCTFSPREWKTLARMALLGRTRLPVSRVALQRGRAVNESSIATRRSLDLTPREAVHLSIG